MIAQAADEHAPQTQRLGSGQGILRHQGRIGDPHQQLLGIAGLGLRGDLAVAMKIGAEHPEFGGAGHIGLIARQMGQLLSELRIGNADDRDQLQEIGAGCGSGRLQNRLALRAIDGLRRKITPRGMTTQGLYG